MSNAFAKFYRGHSNSEPGVCWVVPFFVEDLDLLICLSKVVRMRLGNVLPTDGSLAGRMITTAHDLAPLPLIFHRYHSMRLWRSVTPFFYIHILVLKNYLEPCYWCLSMWTLHTWFSLSHDWWYFLDECIGVPHHMAQSGRQSHGSIFGRTAVCLLEECRCRRGLVVNFSFDAKV